MQNDFEIAGQLDLLSKKISEGITGANKVLEQVRKVELDVSSAEKAKAEIAKVIEVEISRATSEFELEISRATSEFELEISRATSEVQPEISRAETAKAEIAKVIEVGISRAKSEALTQLEEIRELTEQNESTYNKFLQEKLELNKLYTLFESLIKEIGGAAGLKELRRELQEGREVAFKLETYHQQENQKLLLEKMAQQQQQFIRQGKLEQENQKLLLEKMGQQQQQLIGEGKLAILIVSVSVLLISLIK
ncbi:hypothetical protein IQ270_09015 [Microcoleus sp. LEGE 07076]|uniref:hypothetical protein n=1 Tax=Microcoleus sp. LEGE 07076 TaxID=915322 RepID=UPI0018801C14|nr:hypothetical protein [Microcoleus sp. LEGE 07076]MBE9184846.1 hypothetical protein [Microcoleus sp. LEGE 07076]